MTDYVTETLELLGKQDPLAVFAETPSWIAARIKGLSPAALRTPEGPDKWSLTQVIAHMADAEIAFGWRARLVLTEDTPPLQGFDEGLWMTRFDCANADAAQALQAFTALREWNLRVWRSATAKDMQRMAIHPKRGPESYEKLQQMTAGHDLRHRRQIDRIIAVVR